MKIPRTAVLAAFLFSIVSQATDYKPGELIVKYKEGVVRGQSLVGELYDSVGAQNIHYYSGIMSDFEHLILGEGMDVEEAIKIVSQNPLVEYAEPNYIVSLPVISEPPPPVPTPSEGLPCIPGMDIPNCDPKLCWLPGLPLPPGCTDWTPGTPGGPGNPPAERPPLKDAPAEVNPPVADPDSAKTWGLSTIKAQKAWEIHKGSREMIVAVIDTGTDYNHKDIALNLWRNKDPSKGDVVGYDFVHKDGLPYDDQGHGTHTAGTVGAVGDNGVGVSGVAPKVSIMTVKFLSSAGQGTIADAISSLEYAADKGARIMSNSWGGRAAGSEKQVLADAIDKVQKAGILFIAAAGNESKDNDKPSEASYPAAYAHDNIISVAATTETDKLAFFSNYGKESTDLAAPGANVYSLAPRDGYATHSGTSMACPHVAGAAALVWSMHPEWDYLKVKKALLNSVDKLDSLQGKTFTGGRLNVEAALRSTE